MNQSPYCLIRQYSGSIVICLLTTLFTASAIASPQGQIDFGSQIKPILADKCFACHGPDEAQRTTDFRLDQKASALDPAHAVIIPSDSKSSLLVERILSTDPDEVMPPSDHLKHLTVAEKNLLINWIQQGANWSEHWAFQQPIASSDPKISEPNPSDRNWPRNFIDYYILRRLKNISPAPEAQRHTLLRRLSFDLTGLPPSPEQMDQFDDLIEIAGAEDAYRQTVERLLDSPHFGERMAVSWLDLVRYADTVGYHGDQNVSVSPYRDYVINAFNDNMPFDRFTREQLAGDLLENPTQDQLIASGYNRLGMMSAEGGVQPEEYLNKYASDRVRTTAAVWLGITLGCAECHDHKFDPFSSKEFYEFSAFFADIKEQGLYQGAHQTGKWGPSIDIPDPDLPKLLAPIDAEICQLQASLVETAQVRSERIAWEETLLTSGFDWDPIVPESITTLPNVKTETTDEFSILVSGENPKSPSYAIALQVDKNVRAFRLEALPHKSLPHQGPGRAENGNFVVSELILLRGDQTGKLETLKKISSKWPEDLQSQIVKLANPTATIEQTSGGEGHPDKKWSAASVIDGDVNGKTWGWAILPETGKTHELVVRVADDKPLSEQLTIVIRQQHSNGTHSLGHFRISQSLASNAIADPLRRLPENVQQTLRIADSKRSKEQRTAISEYYISIAPANQETIKRHAELNQLRDKTIKQHSRIMLVTVAVPPREIRVLARGNWMDKTGEVVRPGVPRILGGNNWDTDELKTERATRLQLANWIVEKSNPLTARVFVNRTWRMFFGNGISNRLDDLGAQGEPPSHPELLDRLAIEFIDSGWDIKQLVRNIVLSSAYRQSSSLREDLKEIDPENRLLARQSRFRLDAEFIRDNALAVSDLLVREIGGRSVKPYQPPGLYRHLNFPARTYSASTGIDQYRRGIYTHWQRQFLHPALKTFDAPPREECTAARPRSSTPLAALVLLNDPSYVETAKAFAELAIQKGADTPSRIDVVFNRAFSRNANPEEKAVVTELLHSHQTFFEKHAEDAEKLLSIGQTRSQRKINDQSTIAELAAWTSVCRAVINMHEFVLRK